MDTHRKYRNGILVESSDHHAKPAKQWPLWAKALKLLAKPADRGIGDVLARVIGDEKSEAFKAWYKKTFGKDCGCNGRQIRWNRLYPLFDTPP